MKFIEFKPNNSNTTIKTPLQNVVDITDNGDGTSTIRYHINYALCEIYYTNNSDIKYIEL